ncbi:MAG: M14 family metallocarboxypeptidase [Nitrospiria bacterium]
MTKKKYYGSLIHRIEILKKSLSRFEIHVPGYLNYSGQKYPFFVLYLSLNKKPFQGDKKNVCITAGIHGNEPAGVEALLTIIESRIFLDGYLKSCDFMVFPCVNPAGFECRQRENPDGVDLNRQFNYSSAPPEVTYIKELTIPVYFSLHLDLHEDVDAPGFYLYEKVQDGVKPFGEKIIDAVSEKYPINLQEKVEGRTARNGVIGSEEQNRLSSFHEFTGSNSNWPMAFYFYSKGTSHVLTFETPVNLEITERIEIHRTAISTALDSLVQFE